MGSLLVLILIVLITYLLLAYLILPAMWKHHEHHPALSAAPKCTVTGEGIPGDPVNVGFVGTQDEILRCLIAAGWHPADPITFRSATQIVESVLFRKRDPTAPVSSLYLWGRQQDLAFEREVGSSARQRHHVRLWQAPEEFGVVDRPTWIGATTFDVGVGVSRRTGQITHHISPNLDAERDTLITDAKNTQQVLRIYQVTGVGATLSGRNGGGDRYYTDGEMTIAVLTKDNEIKADPPEKLPNPPAVVMKNRIWSFLRKI
ncbi:LssY C-terminal domain-containing protein [bacterium]|nr:LssY C-terminal domain-containing protein [bacterium]